jgi:hypothetical protein
MAAPTNAANVKKVLANPEPSTHGAKRTYHVLVFLTVFLAGCASTAFRMDLT